MRLKSQEFPVLINTFYATSDIRDPQDLSPEIIAAFEDQRSAVIAASLADKNAKSRWSIDAEVS